MLQSRIRATVRETPHIHVRASKWATYICSLRAMIVFYGEQQPAGMKVSSHTHEKVYADDCFHLSIALR